MIQRAEMLAELMRLKYGIAIAGMHGKTTTTSMVASVLAAGGLDPTVVVGGRVDALGSNARLGTTQYLVAEADESDRSFLKLSPILAVVTNLDREHMDCYHDMADVERAFLDFMDRVPFYGAVTACVDNALLKGILPRARRRVFTYGVAAEADFRLELLDARAEAQGREAASRAFRCTRPRDRWARSSCTCPGGTTCSTLRRPWPSRGSLKLRRRRLPRGSTIFAASTGASSSAAQARGVTVVDDYGHHPTEIRATLAAARECAHGRIHVVFQPHRYSRTLDLLDEFGGAFTDADTVVVLPIYAASEEPIPGVTAERLAERIQGPRVQFAPDFAEAVAAVAAAGARRRPDSDARRGQREPTGAADSGGAGGGLSDQAGFTSPLTFFGSLPVLS